MTNYFKTVSDVEAMVFDFEKLKAAWKENQEKLTLEEITEEDIRARGIPEGKTFQSFKGRLNKRPCFGRLVRNRDTVDFTIDCYYRTDHIQGIQKAIEQRIGEAFLTGKLDG